MVDPFLPEGDALEQQQEVVPDPGPGLDEDEVAKPALDYPDGIPTDVPDADYLEQHQAVANSDVWRPDQDGDVDSDRW